MVCADAKPSIQARRRLHETAPPAPGAGQFVEHEYERLGAVTYLDAWDVRRGRVMGRTEPKGGIAAFDRLVCQVMTKEPYREGCQNPVPSRRGPVVLMQEATESISSLDRPIRRWRPRGLGRGWRTSAERSMRTLAVVVLGEDAQDPVELARSEDQ